MKKVKISIKRLTAKHLIFIQIVYNFFVKAAIGQLGLPSTLNYVTDLITAALFVEIIFYEIKQTSKVRRTPVFYIIVIFFVYTLINWLMHLYSPAYYLWGLRNTFRFYVFFVACTMFLNREDVQKMFNIIFGIFLLNIPMASYQYFALGLRNDFVAGFLGSTEAAGSNGSMTALGCLVCIITIVQYIERKGSILKPAIAICGTLLVATLAELKALYLFVVAIVILSSLFTKFSIKKLVIVVIFIMVLPIAMEMMYEIYPEFENFFNLERILQYGGSEGGGYSTDDGVNRFSSIEYCFDNFLKTPVERIFGLGLGAADGSSNFKIVATDFYLKNFDTHYTWFTLPHILIENGIIGVTMFWSIFVIAFQEATRNKRRARGKEREYIIISQLVAIFMILLSIYNSSVRTESVGYALYALLSIPYLLKKKN